MPDEITELRQQLSYAPGLSSSSAATATAKGHSIPGAQGH
jgi:hypothetical protein